MSQQAMSPQAAETRRYIIMGATQLELPEEVAQALRTDGHTVTLAARTFADGTAPHPPEPDQVRVIDAIGSNGPKLVEMPPEGELILRLNTPSIKIIPEVYYERQWERFTADRPPAAEPIRHANTRLAARASAVAADITTSISIKDRTNGQPVAGAFVVAFTDFAKREGSNATSTARGKINLRKIAPDRTLERIYVYPPPGYWGHYAVNRRASELAEIALLPIDVSDKTSLLAQFHDGIAADAGAGVTIGIIDSGVDGSHPDLGNVVGGLNCVSMETAFDPTAFAAWRPAKIKGEHGTHVAGAAAATGKSKLRGVAPAAMLRSYRVFPDTGKGASSFDILKAIDAAVRDKCDIINMSIGGGMKDELTRLSIEGALAAGVVVVVAAGNDGRKQVSYPAAFPGSMAVSAMGRIATFPEDAIGASEIAQPRGQPNTNDFVAAFSNIGAQIDVTGPGVEIVSTLPNGHYGTMSGTSMAAPAIAGMCAVLLASDPSIGKKTGAARSRAIKDQLYARCKPLGFGRDYEGFGLPLPLPAGV